MRVAGHNHVQMLPGHVDQDTLQLPNIIEDCENLIAQVEAHIERDLIVAAAGGVKLAADRTNQFDQAPLDVHVNILPAHIEDELAACDLCLNLLQALND